MPPFSSAAGLRSLTRLSYVSPSRCAITSFPCPAASSRRYYHLSAALYAENHSPKEAPATLLGAVAADAVKPQRLPQQREITDPAASQWHKQPDAAAASTAEARDSSASAGGTATFTEAAAHSESPLRRLFISWQQGVVASIGAVMGIGFLLYFLYTPVKEDTVHHTAVVASEALADARLKGQAVQLSKDVVLEVLRDHKSLDAAVNLVAKLLQREESKIAVSILLQSLFVDHYTLEVTKKFVLQVVQDPWIQENLQGITEEQVRQLLRSPEIQKRLSDFLLGSALESLKKPELQYEVARAVRRSAASLFYSVWS
ncbi:putative mitochondrial hypothetical protein [Leptomonas pyrrhocoris]|uniref:Transmembrane protein n=1 Tax=Leptomonas pyrrhocoris TaxID=157538 RepID=A0A0M9G505_LEPPY|nr:putative mitochondrial hypothetical protein [Leptomonas pyrrhocoris]XP_015660968.1 putative mitochondrial hypothetical protein [Leptomonas pyrrhocoris]XP_015660969.1 putative mitochondrial hypothetical protein [Leptomonas pyrrhocoris]KPA82528.1 putative mitochondrial hypothetical protein [Leptomonas pyrrhocoris]KPA82529.1 putative mitochondrial hypothetical protein [Leptomonas pyrrhocoris]KPA82530.1 putative mitochondrial hypothetical protein [Leptomonas pyrrhocoris]|eukprot:XP_015660967.1 putative mitochondrial hypothetical protein [Leptomonas pyrrhocoris]